MRTIGAATVGRSDYGPLRPVLRRIQMDPELKLQLFVAGTHLAAQYGHSVRDVEADGFPIAARVETHVPGDTPQASAQSIGRAVCGFAAAFERSRPDILLVLGDRFDMFAAALAALPLAIPVAHIHGGELTEGAIDDALRHALTKLSHLHFAATAEYARRIRQLGEESWRVTTSGAPGLDDIAATKLLGEAELSSRLGLRLAADTLLVTYHPVTLDYGGTARHIGELLAALGSSGLPAVFTSPNGDAGSELIVAAIRGYVAAHPGSGYVENLGSQAYFSLMSVCAAMVGNSSSGIVEAASFALPVVNVGNRQKGRMRARNVLDAGESAPAIAAAIREATAPSFRRSLAGLANPYGDGRAGETIVARLKSVPLDARLLNKAFADA